MVDLRKYDVSDVHVEAVSSVQRAENSVDYSRATAVFQKEWDDTESTGKTFSGKEVEKLTFASSAEGWKIVREEEAEIKEVHRGRAALSLASSSPPPDLGGTPEDITPPSAQATDFSGDWQGEYTNRGTNHVTKINLHISRDSSDLLTGNLIVGSGSSSPATCAITGVYNVQSKFMLLSVSNCQGGPSSDLQGNIGFSSVGSTDRNIVGVDSLHNGLMNMSRQ